MDSQKKYPKAYSVEFFPPKSEESALRLRETCAQLAPIKPSFASVTFGAGGSTQERTFETVRGGGGGAGGGGAPRRAGGGAAGGGGRRGRAGGRARGGRRRGARR